MQIHLQRNTRFKHHFSLTNSQVQTYPGHIKQTKTIKKIHVKLRFRKAFKIALRCPLEDKTKLYTCIPKLHQRLKAGLVKSL